ncbi:arabinosyltransferase domain-containing protein [Pseudonocardia alni subsp. carboxydivorans]|uniref:Arabinosyltransferase domain-containing protein n=1 Tax=Pseudonocardia alni subsp. carboxydivorans TaxID=415010 RepID=A0ABU9ACL3_PSEA5
MSRWSALAGAFLGLSALLLAAVFAVAPVVQSTASYSWDTSAGVVANPVPLTAYRPLGIEASVSCAQFTALPDGGAVLSTTAEPGPTGTSPDGLWIGAVTPGAVSVMSAGRTLYSGPDCDLSVRIGPGDWRIARGGDVLAQGAGDVRPYVAGFFSQLPSATSTAGLSATVTADTRFETAASGTKIALAVVCATCAVLCLLVAGLHDRRHARRVSAAHPRARKLVGADLPVVVLILLWTVIGPVTVDDGYTTTMVADAARSGFVGGYHHWLNSPEAPFGSFYEVYRWWAGEGTPLLWMRLPALLLALLAWWMLSRIVVFRLLPGGRGMGWVPWVAAVAFLAGWLPFNVGLRSEPYVAVGTVAVWCLVEHGIAARRLLPIALATLLAGLTLTTAPTGLVAIVVLLVAAPAVLRLMLHRRGAVPVTVGAVAGSVGLVVLVMFADQTVGAVRAGTAIRTAIGPNFSWSDEWTRYQALLKLQVEGAFGRRAAVLVLVTALVVSTTVLVRRRRIVGTHHDRLVRFLAATAAGLAALAFVPTKWSHHFGGFAGHLTVLVVVVTWIGCRAVRREADRALILSAIALAAALALSGSAMWWMASAEQVTFWDIPPQVLGVRLATIALSLGVGWLLVGIFLRDHQRIRRYLVPPIGLVVVTLLIGTTVLQTYGLVRATVLTPGYSQPRTTAAALVGDNCGLDPYLRVEPDPAVGLLPVAPGPNGATVSTGGMRRPADRVEHASREGLPATDMWTVDDGSPGSLRSDWYALPADASGPVVVEVGGSGRGRVTVEFGRNTPTGPAVIAEMLVDLQPRVSPARFDPIATAPGADLVRVVAVQEVSEPDSWLTVSRPRVPRTIPLSAFVPATAPALLDWPIAPLLTCRRQATLAGGIAEVPDVVVTPGRDLPEAMARSAGGPFAGLLQAYRLQPVPTYVDGMPTTWRAEVLRLVPREPLRPPMVARGMMTVSGLSGRPPLVWTP